jgi:hypothetical protein
MIKAKEIFNRLTWISEYWDGDYISLHKDRLEGYLEELETEIDRQATEPQVEVEG